MCDRKKNSYVSFFVTTFLLILSQSIPVHPFCHTLYIKEIKQWPVINLHLHQICEINFIQDYLPTNSSPSITKPPYSPAILNNLNIKTLDLFRLCFHIDQIHSRLLAKLYICFNVFYSIYKSCYRLPYLATGNSITKTLGN